MQRVYIIPTQRKQQYKQSMNLYEDYDNNTIDDLTSLLTKRLIYDEDQEETHQKRNCSTQFKYIEQVEGQTILNHECRQHSFEESESEHSIMSPSKESRGVCLVGESKEYLSLKVQDANNQFIQKVYRPKRKFGQIKHSICKRI